jgi:hypothetical protein
MTGSRRMRWTEHVAAWVGKIRNAYEVLIKKPQGKKTLRRLRRR